MIESPRNSVSSNINKDVNDSAGKMTNVIDLTNANKNPYFLKQNNEAKIEENKGEIKDMIPEGNQESLHVVLKPDIKKEFDVFCLVKERGLMLNYKEIIEINEIIKEIESVSISVKLF